MATSIIITNESIKILVGKFSGTKVVVEKVINAPLDEGIILNGIITDDLALRKKFEEIWRNNKLSTKNLNLVIDSSSIQIKILDAPRLNQKKLLQFVKGEFPEIENPDDMVFDYSVISLKNDDGGVRLLACCAEREYIESYMEVFNALKFDIDKIDITLNAMIKVFSFLKIYKNKTFVITSIDKNTAAQALFVNGNYSFYKRFRVVAERGTEEFFNEIDRSLSTIIQFNKSEKTGFDITDMYFGGLTEEEESFLPAWCETTGCAVAKLPDNHQITFKSQKKATAVKPTLSDYIYSVGNLIELK